MQPAIRQRGAPEGDLRAAEASAALALLDDLAERGAQLDGLLTAAAAALGATVGFSMNGGACRACTPEGFVDLPARPAGTLSRTIPGVGDVWLTANGLAETEPVTTLLLRRLAICVKLALAVHGPPAASAADLLVVVDHAATRSSRLRAMARMGLDEGTLVTVVAMSGSAELVEGFAEALRQRGRVVADAPCDGRHLFLVTELDPRAVTGVPAGLRAAFVGPRPAADAPSAWRLARLALRFTKPSPRAQGPYQAAEAVFIDGSELGGYALLAESLDPTQIALVPDVRALRRLVQEYGDEMLVCLEAVAATESLRSAARQLHLHHNSVAHRVERAERILGFSFTAPYGRTRLFLALVLRRLQESSRLFEPPASDGEEPAPSDQ